MKMFYQIIVNRKHLKKLTRFLEKYGYKNYHYCDNNYNGSEILFEVFRYNTLAKHENILHQYGKVGVINGN